MALESTRLVVDLESTWSQLLGLFMNATSVFMNNCLESTLRCLIDYFIKTSLLVFSDCLNREKIRGFGQIVCEVH